MEEVLEELEVEEEADWLVYSGQKRCITSVLSPFGGTFSRKELWD